MKKRTQIFTLLLSLVSWISIQAQTADTLFVEEQQIPILIDRQDNVLFRMRINANQLNQKLNQIALRLSGDINNIKAVKLYYAGTEALQNAKNRFAPVNYVDAYKVGQTRAANASYSLLLNRVKNPTETVTFVCDKLLFTGVNYFWVSIEMKKNTSLLARVEADVTEAVIDEKKKHY